MHLTRTLAHILLRAHSALLLLFFQRAVLGQMARLRALEAPVDSSSGQSAALWPRLPHLKQLPVRALLLSPLERGVCSGGLPGKAVAPLRVPVVNLLVGLPDGLVDL